MLFKTTSSTTISSESFRGSTRICNEYVQKALMGAFPNFSVDNNHFCVENQPSKQSSVCWKLA